LQFQTSSSSRNLSIASTKRIKTLRLISNVAAEVELLAFKIKGPLPVLVTAEDEAFKMLLPEAKFFTALFKSMMLFIAFSATL
jgi:hypothetical protein